MWSKEHLKPDLYVTNVLDIPLEELAARGIKGLIIDLDNTITEWNSYDLKEEIVTWFKKLQHYKLKSCIVSNNGRQRVEKIGVALGIPAIHKAGKPRQRAFRQAMMVLGTDEQSTAVVGDQIFTDVLGGKRLGLFTILVKPLHPREFIGTRFMRQLERVVIKTWQK